LSLVQAFALDGYAQATRLNLALNDAAVRDVLQEIEEMSEFRFLYNSKMVDVDREVDIALKNETIDKALQNLFEETNVAYRIIDRQVVLFTEDEPVYGPSASQQQAVSGNVTDSNGYPLPGVTVVVKGTTQGTVTDADGNYRLT